MASLRLPVRQAPGRHAASVATELRELGRAQPAQDRPHARGAEKLLAHAATIDRLLRAERTSSCPAGAAIPSPPGRCCCRSRSAPSASGRTWLSAPWVWTWSATTAAAPPASSPNAGWPPTARLSGGDASRAEPSQKWVFQQALVPEPGCRSNLQGIHSDSGSGVHQQPPAGQQHDVTFTAAYRKNDNNFTEQKNVRRGAQARRLRPLRHRRAVELLNELYDRLRVVVNFMRPVREAHREGRRGARVLARRYRSSATKAGGRSRPPSRQAGYSSCSSTRADQCGVGCRHRRRTPAGRFAGHPLAA